MSDNNLLSGNKVTGLFIFLAILVGISILTQKFYLPAIIIGLCIAIHIILEKPEFTLFTVILTYPLLNIVVVHNDVPPKSLAIAGEVNNILLMDIFILIAILTILLGRITRTVKPFKTTTVDLPLLSLYTWALLSLVWARNDSASISIIIKFLFCIVLFYIPLFLLKDNRTLIYSLWVFLFSGVVAGIGALSTLFVEAEVFSLFQYKIFTGKDLILRLHIFYMENLGARVAGLADPNRMANLLSTAVFISFGLFLITKKKWLKYIIFIALLFILIVDLHTMSKAGLGSLLIAFAVFIFASPYFKGKRIKTLVLGCAIVFVILSSILFIQEGGFGRFGRNPLETRSQSSLANRFEWWSADFKRLYESYGIGTGIGGMSDFEWAYAQSSYFSLLAELGFIGFLIFLWLIYTFSINIYSLICRIRNNLYYFTITLSFVCALLTFVIHSLVDFSYIMRFPWFIAGFILAIIRLSTEDKEIKYSNFNKKL